MQTKNLQNVLKITFIWFVFKKGFNVELSFVIHSLSKTLGPYESGNKMQVFNLHLDITVLVKTLQGCKNTFDENALYATFGCMTNFPYKYVEYLPIYKTGPPTLSLFHRQIMMASIRACLNSNAPFPSKRIGEMFTLVVS